MKPAHIFFASAAITLFACPGWSQVLPDPPPDVAGAQNPAETRAAADQSVEVMMRGPLHEAFAQPFSSDPVPGIVTEQPPPEPITELAPEMMPEGAHVVWIPGYWAFEPEDQRYLWVSGVWRDAPPGQQWIPGYWAELAGERYQWVSGFWTSSEDELTYLPYPPESVEEGPTSPAPEGDFFWVPGAWVYRDAQYIWRPGYWAPIHENWVWMPGQYVWTPQGCIYTQGYWDRPLDRRGVVFAPVRFLVEGPQLASYRYTPSYVLNLVQTMPHWFVSPRAHHYYFGNYYVAQADRSRLLPWYSVETRYGYDPLLTYYQWHYARRDVAFVDRLQSWHRYYVGRESARPAITLSAAGRGGVGAETRFRFVEPVDRWAASVKNTMQLRRLEQSARDQLTENAGVIRRLQQTRGRIEHRQAVDADREQRRLPLDSAARLRGAAEMRGGVSGRVDAETETRLRAEREAPQRLGRSPDIRGDRGPATQRRVEKPRGYDPDALRSHLEQRLEQRRADPSEREHRRPFNVRPSVGPDGIDRARDDFLPRLPDDADQPDAKRGRGQGPFEPRPEVRQSPQPSNQPSPRPSPEPRNDRPGKGKPEGKPDRGEGSKPKVDVPQPKPGPAQPNPGPAKPKPGKGNPGKGNPDKDKGEGNPGKDKDKDKDKGKGKGKGKG